MDTGYYVLDTGWLKVPRVAGKSFNTYFHFTQRAVGLATRK